MAILDNNKTGDSIRPSGVEGVNGGNATSGSTYKSGQAESKQASSYMGFGLNPMFTMAANNGSEYTNKIAKSITEIYKGLPTGERPKVSILDKEVIPGLAYSSIVVSMSANNIVDYYIIALEATGRSPMTAADIMAEVQSSLMTKGQIPFIYVPGDAIDAVLHEKIRTVLVSEYGEGHTYTSVDGLVVPNVQHEDDQLAVRVASIAFNACKAEKELITGNVRDLNIRVAKQQSPHTILKLESNLLKQTIKDEVDNPIRSDWQMELNAVDTTNNITSLNLQNAKTTLTRSTGFIDAIPQAIQIPTVPGTPPAQAWRLHPHLIISSNSVYATTPGYTLLGLISSLTMINDNMWVAALMPKDNKKALRNVGALNIITNIENNANGIGTVLDLSDKAIKPEEAYATIKNMFSEAPVVSYDIEAYGPQTHYSSIFALASQPGNSSAKWDAAKNIVEAAHWLTDGRFPSDYPLSEIFIGSGIMVPVGKWTDKTGERDIRDIDTAFVATQTQDSEMINKWILSGLPEEKTGLDPFTSKIDIISKLIPNAVISGKAVRVTFTANFISTLIEAAVGAGLNANYEPSIKFVETTSLDVLNQYIGNAGINNQASFARQATSTGPTYSTNFSTMGSWR